MKRYIYSLKDELSGFRDVICDDNDACAVRGFEGIIRRIVVNDPSHVPYADDLSLCRIGSFDTDTGIIVDCPNEVLARGKAIRLVVESEMRSKEVSDEEV